MDKTDIRIAEDMKLIDVLKPLIINKHFTITKAIEKLNKEHTELTNKTNQNHIKFIAIKIEKNRERYEMLNYKYKIRRMI